MIKVKCLTDRQMEYIKHHHTQKTAKQMADALKVEMHKVALFCQVNAIEPVPGRKPKRFDAFNMTPQKAWCWKKIHLPKSIRVR